MKQDNHIHIKINAELKQKAERKAAELGLTLSAYIRYLLTNNNER